MTGCAEEDKPSRPADTSATTEDTPPTLVEACGDGYDLTARSFWQETGDGVRLHMIEAGSGKTTAVLAHGGRSSLCDTLPFAARLVAAGYRIVAFDFRGNGLSESPSKNRLALGKDLAAGVAYARETGAERVFLIGSSMGGAAIVQNTSTLRVEGRISLSGTRLWPGFGINNPAGLARIRAPFLYVGSRDDWRAPLKEALGIFRRVGAVDKHTAFYPGSYHGWQLLDSSPFAPRREASSSAGSRATHDRRDSAEAKLLGGARPRGARERRTRWSSALRLAPRSHGARAWSARKAVSVRSKRDQRPLAPTSMVQPWPAPAGSTISRFRVEARRR